MNYDPDKVNKVCKEAAQSAAEFVRKYEAKPKRPCSPKLLAANKRTAFKKPLPVSRADRKRVIEQALAGGEGK